MTIKVTNDDVLAAAIACSNADELMKKLPVTEVGMRAALESFVARHPELGGRRAMHEPVSEAELEAMMDAIHYGPSGTSWADNVCSAGNGLLAGRAAPKYEPVEIMPGLTQAFLQEVGIAQTEPNIATAGAALHWLADRINGKRGKPVDPRVAVFTKAMVERGYDLGSVEDFEFILGKLDNAKT